MSGGVLSTPLVFDYFLYEAEIEKMGLLFLYFCRAESIW